MRLDVFLRLSRLIPRRTLAQEFCDKGRIAVNGSKAKSSKEVKPGDEIELRRRDTITRIKVLSVPDRKQLSKEEASGIFEMVASESVAEPDLLA
ncbi:MAG: S4 domain-containing protein [Pyrinomonadaceae bacterium]